MWIYIPVNKLTSGAFIFMWIYIPVNLYLACINNWFQVRPANWNKVNIMDIRKILQPTTAYPPPYNGQVDACCDCVAVSYCMFLLFPINPIQEPSRAWRPPMKFGTLLSARANEYGGKQKWCAGTSMRYRTYVLSLSLSLYIYSRGTS